MKYKIGDLIVYLARGGESDAALQLAKESFALVPEPEGEERDPMPWPEPRGWLEEWKYKEALQKAVPVLVGVEPRRTLEWLCSLLAAALERSSKGEDHGFQDYSSIWRDAIEHEEQPARLRNTLISALRDAAEQAIVAAPQNRAHVFGILRQEQWTVFKRIELHLLRRFADLMLEDFSGGNRGGTGDRC